jgi:hypothetical protein
MERGNQKLRQFAVPIRPSQCVAFKIIIIMNSVKGMAIDTTHALKLDLGQRCA